MSGALIFTHLNPEGSSFFGRILRERGHRIRTINTPRRSIANIDPLRPDLLIVMGGPIGVYQADHYPFLYKELEILERRLAADKPTLGICLGAQLMAKALGSDVYPGPHGKEQGWSPLSVNASGKKTPIHHLDGEKTQMFQWHGDTFDLPKNAKLLASSEQYENQIFSVGKNCLGLQCHPEVTENQLKEWMVMFVKEITVPDAQIGIEELREQNAKYVDTLNKQSRTFFNEWLDTVGL